MMPEQSDNSRWDHFKINNEDRSKVVSIFCKGKDITKKCRNDQIRYRFFVNNWRNRKWEVHQKHKFGLNNTGQQKKFVFLLRSVTRC